MYIYVNVYYSVKVLLYASTYKFPVSFLMDYPVENYNNDMDGMLQKVVDAVVQHVFNNDEKKVNEKYSIAFIFFKE